MDLIFLTKVGLEPLVQLSDRYTTNLAFLALRNNKWTKE
jgi:hypothetical protein